MTSPYPGNADWPAHWHAATLTGKFINADGSIPAGQILLTPAPDVVFVPIDNQVVVPDQITIDLDVHGAFTKRVPGSNDTHITPSGWTYTVEETWVGGRTYQIVAPVGVTTDITLLAPVGKFQGVLMLQGLPGPMTQEMADARYVQLSDGWTREQADARYVRTVNHIGPDGDGDVEVTGGVTPPVSRDGHGALLFLVGPDLAVSSDGAGTLSVTASGSVAIVSDGAGSLVITE